MAITIESNFDAKDLAYQILKYCEFDEIKDLILTLEEGFNDLELTKELADELNISRERVRQIYHKVFFKMTRFIIDISN